MQFALAVSSGEYRSMCDHLYFVGYFHSSKGTEFWGEMARIQYVKELGINIAKLFKKCLNFL